MAQKPSNTLNTSISLIPQTWHQESRFDLVNFCCRHGCPSHTQDCLSTCTLSQQVCMFHDKNSNLKLFLSGIRQREGHSQRIMTSVAKARRTQAERFVGVSGTFAHLQVAAIEHGNADVVCCERLDEGHAHAGDEVVAPALKLGVQSFTHHQDDIQAASPWHLVPPPPQHYPGPPAYSPLHAQSLCAMFTVQVSSLLCRLHTLHACNQLSCAPFPNLHWAGQCFIALPQEWPSSCHIGLRLGKGALEVQSQPSCSLCSVQVSGSLTWCPHGCQVSAAQPLPHPQ